MSKVNSINNKSGELTIDPGASGDSFVQFDINTTGEFRIGVDDTDDSFRISQGSALGTNDTFVMSAAGENTMPLQPCFLAHRNADLTNVTGNSVLYTIVWDSEEFDRGGDFDGTSTFTAPVTGVYYFTSTILGDDIVSGTNTRGFFEMVATGDTYRSGFNNPGAIQTSNQLSFSISAVVPMTAADTIYVRWEVDYGTQIVDISGNTTEGVVANWFSGYLMV